MYTQCIMEEPHLGFVLEYPHLPNSFAILKLQENMTLEFVQISVEWQQKLEYQKGLGKKVTMVFLCLGLA